MMNPSDAPSPADSAAFSAQTPAVSPEPALLPHPSEPALLPHPSEPALLPHSPEPALLAYSPESDLTPVEDVALDVTPDQVSPGDERNRLSLLAETVGVQKAWRGAGFVTISRRTVEEQVQIPVTLRHEEITMTRFFRDPNAPEATPDGITLSPEFGAEYGQGTVVMRLHEEVAEVVKVVRVAEEVEFARRIVTEETRVIGSARHEELDVKSPQNVPVSLPKPLAP